MQPGTEARSTPAEALDVPRLRDALRRVYKSRYHERFAEPLAAEYARLSPHNREADHEPGPNLVYVDRDPKADHDHIYPASGSIGEPEGEGT
jgi:hypothetical protein